MANIEPRTLDVRAELRNGGEPLPQILDAVSKLVPGQGLRLLVTFELLPLYAVLARKGFAHSATRHGQGNWEVLFTPGETSNTPKPKVKAAPAAGAVISNWRPPRVS